MNSGKTTVGEILSSTAHRFPEKLAIIDKERRMTYSELEDAVNRFAASLLKLETRKGDRIALLFHNSIEFAISYLGIVKIGAVAVPLNWRLAAPELAQCCDIAEPSAVIYDGRYLETIQEMRPVLQAVSNYVHAGTGVPDWAADYDVLLNGPSAGTVPEFDWDVTESDDVDIFFTGGTTGIPKGVVMRHGCLAWVAVAEQIEFGFTQHDVMIHAAPMFHIAVTHDLFVTGILTGATHVIMEAFHPVTFMEWIERYKVTAGLMVPAVSYALLSLPNLGTYDTRSLRMYITASAPMPEAVIKKVEASFPHSEFIEEYGATESNCISILRAKERSGHLGSCGKPAFGVKVKVVDVVSGEELPVGEKGELVIKSLCNMKGYWRNEKATMDAQWRPGWYRSGDGGYMDADGYVYISDRIKDMIITGGENVYAAEVEKVVLEHPEVAEVAIIGTKDERWGEAVTAIVVLKSDAKMSIDELKSFCQGKIAGYKIPKKMHIVGTLPRTAFMKINKRQIREMFP